MSKKTSIILFAIILLAFLVRGLYLPRGALTFGYDQARDAFVAQEIVNGDLKILGPPASTPGLYHGVFYYYLIAPAYLVGQGNPLIAAYWIALLNALGTIVVFLLAYTFTRKKSAGFLAAVCGARVVADVWQ